YVRTCTGRTIRWAERSLKVHAQKDLLMFGIVQGGMYENLRDWCVREMTPMPFDGFAVGGLGVGEGEELLQSIGAFTVALLPENRPRYLMGVGQLQEHRKGVRGGRAMFACVLAPA